jgi:hypothetical protein
LARDEVWPAQKRHKEIIGVTISQGDNQYEDIWGKTTIAANVFAAVSLALDFALFM